MLYKFYYYIIVYMKCNKDFIKHFTAAILVL